MEKKLPTESKFLSELGKEAYPETTAPHPTPIFRWNFSGKKAYRYLYEQKVEALNIHQLSDGEFSDTTSLMTGNGKLVLKSKGNRTADLILRNLKMKMTVDMGRTGEEDESEPHEDDEREDGAGDDQDRDDRGEAHGQSRLLKSATAA